MFRGDSEEKEDKLRRLKRRVALRIEEKVQTPTWNGEKVPSSEEKKGELRESSLGLAEEPLPPDVKTYLKPRLDLLEIETKNAISRLARGSEV